MDYDHNFKLISIACRPLLGGQSFFKSVPTNLALSTNLVTYTFKVLDHNIGQYTPYTD
jgi:hypothetical protein